MTNTIPPPNIGNNLLLNRKPGESRITASASAGLAYATMKTLPLLDHLGGLFWSVVAPINNIAIMETQEAYTQLSRSPFFRHSVKRYAKLTLQRISNYEQKTLKTMQYNLHGDHRQFWLDYTDEYYERMRPHINILRQSVLQILTRYQIPYRNLKSHLVVSNALLNYSIGMYDKYFDKVKENFSVDFQNSYNAARLSFVQSSWLNVVDTLCRSNAEIDLNDDPKVKLAFQILEHKCIDRKLIGEICEKAIDYNPDIVEELADKPTNPYNSNSTSIMSTIFT